jgi:hypothetical protein
MTSDLEKLALETIKAFEALQRAYDKKFQGKWNDHLTEAHKRLQQAFFLLKKVSVLEAENIAVSKELAPPGFMDEKNNARFANPDEYVQSAEYKEWERRSATPEWKAKARANNSDEFELYTECFYWIAFRARNLIRLLPELEKFEAKGVRNTRNQLLEHSEGKNSGVIYGGFGWGAPQGPVLKALRLEQLVGIFPDAGLYANAQEYFEELNERINKLI